PLDELDVVLHSGVERQHVAPVDGDRVAGFQVDQVDVRGPVGQEQVTGPADLHQRYALAGQLGLQPLAHAARTECLELQLPLVGDHRACTDHDLAVDTPLEHRGVLQPTPGLCRLL